MGKKLFGNGEKEGGGAFSLEDEEDAIGLRAHATVADPEVVRDAQNGDLIGWSFGYYDVPEGTERMIENGMPLRYVRDMDLFEVSLLNRSKSPAFEGTLVTVREDTGKPLLRGAEIFYEEKNESDTAEPGKIETDIEKPIERSEQENIEPETIDYSRFENLIKEMKGEKTKI